MRTIQRLRLLGFDKSKWDKDVGAHLALCSKCDPFNNDTGIPQHKEDCPNKPNLKPPAKRRR